MDTADAQSFFNAGKTLQDKGLIDEALALYRRVIELDSTHAGAHHNIGQIFHLKGSFNEAIAWYQKALAINPNFASYFNLGELFAIQRMYQDALENFFMALQINTTNEWVYFKIAHVLEDMGLSADAGEYYKRSLEINPAFTHAWNNLGNTLRSQQRFDEALACYEKAAQLDPSFFEAIYNIGTTLGEQGRIGEAKSIFDGILKKNPGDLLARWGKCMSHLPVLFPDNESIEIARNSYQDALRELRKLIFSDNFQDIDRAVEAVGSHQPFFLACQGQNDRELQKMYGEIVYTIMAKKYPEYAGSASENRLIPGERIRVGIVSAYFSQHSIWKIPLSGWLHNLHRCFDLYGYHTGTGKDHATEIARQQCKCFVENIHSLDELCRIISNDRLHVLLYPEIGMHPLTLKLAALRLAPVQCTTLGHPDTSGLPTIDYYLSSELMEPPDAEAHYTETLVRLPNLSCYYIPLDITPAEITRRDLHLDPGAVIYLCSHSLFTHLPQYDFVYPRIAHEVGNCRFVFISIKPHLTHTFQSRIAEAFKKQGLNPDDYLTILPFLEQEKYKALNQLADIFLDTIGWSANNSTFEALACDLPVVTLPGALMRQRHCTGILRMMGMTETIASSIEDYIALAVKLGKDTAWRSHLSEKIANNKDRLYRDSFCIEALEKFLKSRVREKGGLCK